MSPAVQGPFKDSTKEGESPTTVKIDLHLDEIMKDRLTALLQKNIDLFAWSIADMLGIDPEVISHHLKVDPTCHLVKQKK